MRTRHSDNKPPARLYTHMKNNPFSGINQLLQGLKMLTQPGLRRYLLAPIAINIVVFVIIGWIGFSQFDSLLNTFLPDSGWLSFALAAMATICPECSADHLLYVYRGRQPDCRTVQ